MPLHKKNITHTPDQPNPTLEPLVEQPILDHVQPETSITNAAATHCHSMTTRSKSGIYKPKVLHVKLGEPTKPSTLDEALRSGKWQNSHARRI